MQGMSCKTNRRLGLALVVLMGFAGAARAADLAPPKTSPMAGWTPMAHHKVIDTVVGVCLARCSAPGATGDYAACNSGCMAHSLPAEYPTVTGWQKAEAADLARMAGVAAPR
jgi:hypothetical protein